MNRRVTMPPSVIAVSCSSEHTFSKPNKRAITLIAGFGVEGDAHAGKHVKHRYFVKKDASRPNIRQVHLIHSELFDELSEKGFTVRPGELGENITTLGVDLLSLPTGARLHIGADAVVELAALRSPCYQIDEFQHGLLKEVAHRDAEGNMVRKTGVMGIVVVGGVVRPGDAIEVALPHEPRQPLEYIW